MQVQHVERPLQALDDHRAPGAVLREVPCQVPQHVEIVEQAPQLLVADLQLGRAELVDRIPRRRQVVPEDSRPASVSE